MNKYVRTLAREEAKDKARPNPFADLSRENVESAIAAISAAMKGPMSDTERACHYLDRQLLRSRLAELDAVPST